MLGDWATFFLALLLVPALLIEETSSDSTAVAVATATNAAIWFAFLIDYALDLWRAGDRRRYIRTHWADLALIVVSPPLLVPPEAQALRALRALRALQAVAVIGIVVERLGRPITRGAVLWLFALLALVLIAGGLLIVAVEPGTMSTVAQGYAWAVATLMTGGHAEPTPVSAVGRAISTLIVVMGLGTFAALAASIASAS